MKAMRICAVLVVVAVLFGGITISACSAEDSKEVLTLKRDLAAERVQRLQAQMVVLQQQFRDSQEALEIAKKDFKTAQDQLKAMEPAKAEKPEKAEKKK
jgi:outer membrane murein-binding lipoprotein Lpp